MSPIPPRREYGFESVPAKKLLEEVRFSDAGLVPAIAQDAATGDVLMLAWMDGEALQKTLDTGLAHYHSRTRERLWKKGEESGHLQHIRAVFYDCDGDTLLLHVEQEGVACHTGRWSCFFRGSQAADGKARAPQGPRVLDALFEVVRARKGADPKESYTAGLFAKGLPAILAKIEEESGELVEAGAKKNKTEVVRELSDVLFHSLVLLAERGADVSEVYAELSRRFGTSGHEEKKSRAPAPRKPSRKPERKRARKRSGSTGKK